MRGDIETVKETGAASGATLEGTFDANAGMRVKVDRQQARGRGGRLKGGFTLVAAGHGTYAAFLRPFVNREFRSVTELLDEVRREPAAIKATHILNANLLRVVAD